jgi:hypothetical protein
MNRGSRWMVMFAVLGLIGCNKEKKEDCRTAIEETSKCERTVGARTIATGPSYKTMLDQYRGEVRVCGGLDRIHRLGTPEVQSAMKQFADYYSESTVVCETQHPESCELKGPPKAKLDAAKKALDAACD